MRLYSCLCDYKEIENEANTDVKGYVLISECDDCKAKREAAAEKQAIEDQVVKEDELLQAQRKEQAKLKLQNLGLTEEEINALIK